MKHQSCWGTGEVFPEEHFQKPSMHAATLTCLTKLFALLLNHPAMWAHFLTLLTKYIASSPGPCDTVILQKEMHSSCQCVKLEYSWNTRSSISGSVHKILQLMDVLLEALAELADKLKLLQQMHCWKQWYCHKGVTKLNNMCKDYILDWNSES